MKLFTEQEFENAKFRDKLPCNCDFCGIREVFLILLKEIAKKMPVPKSVKILI